MPLPYPVWESCCTGVRKLCIVVILCFLFPSLQVAPSKADVDAELSKAEVDEDADYKPKPVKRPNSYGAIPG